MVILARHVNRLSETVIEKLDVALFRGEMKRQALKEAIHQELLQREAHEDAAAEDQAQDDAEQHARPQYRELREALEPLFDALDLAALREQITLVFDEWNEISGDERHQLFARLNCLIDRLQTIQETIRQRPNPVGL